MNQILIDALQQHGIPAPDRTLKDSGVTRWGKNSRYWAVRLDRYNWVFGDFCSGIRAFVFQNNKTERTPQQIAKLHQRLQQEQARERERIENQYNCKAIIAQRDFDSLPVATPAHLYLARKQIQPHDARYQAERDALKIPLYDTDGKLWNLQTITAVGEKRFLPGARKKGLFFQFGETETFGLVIICEGWATGASLHEATQLPVFVAFDAGNIAPVAESLVKKYPKHRIIIAADNDWEKIPNTGRETAIRVARQFGLSVIIPYITAPGASDWNDLHCAYGLDEVRRQFTKGEII
ncbi:MAG: toprim domain-containing protein [Alphaproteobacteria bacterium]|nr:toprim domain-containing protein [Alphaproteobacteria bacterium]